MAPGPKKKHSKRGAAENPQDCKSNLKPNPQNNKDLNNEKEQLPLDSSNTEVQKFGKRSLKSNWDKYEEPKADPFVDTLRGDDFDVVISYSGGSESQLQLQDEKDWDDGFLNEKNIVLDFQNLANAVKCIPFHERINLPADIFDEAQVAKFISSAEKWKELYKIKNIPPAEQNLKETENLDTNFSIVESDESSESDDSPIKNYVIEEKTGSIIDSLTSSLSLKNWAKEKPDDIVPESKESAKQSDDLDFLLSLSIPSKELSSAPEKEIKDLKSQKSTNVDDWLNSILDD